MRAPAYSGQFKRDPKAARKRGKDMEKFKALMRLLIDEKLLSPHYKNHPLKSQQIKTISRRYLFLDMAKSCFTFTPILLRKS